MTPMSSNRSAAGVTVFEGRIYVSGGHDGLQIFSSVSLGSSWAKGTYTPFTCESYFERTFFGKRLSLATARESVTSGPQAICHVL